jgi:cation:H+ antiporter
LLVASGVQLTAGSELFAEHASAAGRRFGVTALAIRLALGGAEPEEMVTAIFAPARHLPSIAAADAIGANVTMLTVVLGLAALARPLAGCPTQGQVPDVDALAPPFQACTQALPSCSRDLS